ncbi:MAG: Flp pilus assembly complex ATPase component [Desulfobacteraceae bacterium]|nr:Flp pilus assembly complex ATPase component [Desulfobacteraceae bacterium]
MDVLLKQHLKPLEKYFNQKNVVELCINEPGSIWIETLDGWQEKKDKNLTLQSLNFMVSALATAQGQTFDETTPFLATALPEFGFRVQAVGEGLADSGICIAIRIAQAQRFDLESYMSKTDAKELKKNIKIGKTILIVGGTSSGKTTFFNSMIRVIPKDVRLVVIEDTKELVVDQPNTVRWLKSKTGTDVAQVTYVDIINSAMRVRPDRILMGELDLHNTVPFLRLLNAGHGGSMATLHANGTKEAIDAIVLNSQLSGLQGGPELITEYAKKALDIIVYIERKNRRTFKAIAEYIK